MSELKITSNYHHIPLLSGWELTKKERKELDYIADVNDTEKWMDETNRFFRYRGNIYDTHEFVRIEKMRTNPFTTVVDDDSPLAKWQGYHSDSFFSGIVYRHVDDETIQVGLYLS